MKSKSRFSALLTAERDPEPEPSSADKVEAGEPPEERRTGRPRGRRSSPDFQSVTAFLHKDTYRRTRIRLIEEGGEFGELVDRLLREWLAKQ